MSELRVEITAGVAGLERALSVARQQFSHLSTSAQADLAKINLAYRALETRLATPTLTPGGAFQTQTLRTIQLLKDQTDAFNRSTAAQAVPFSLTPGGAYQTQLRQTTELQRAQHLAQITQISQASQAYQSQTRVVHQAETAVAQAYQASTRGAYGFAQGVTAASQVYQAQTRIVQQATSAVGQAYQASVQASQGYAAFAAAGGAATAVIRSQVTALQSGLVGALNTTISTLDVFNGRYRIAASNLVSTGFTLAAIGAAFTVPLVLSAREAIRFEDAMAGVRKTVGLTKPEVDELGRGFLDLSLKSAITAQEMAGVAQIAGQLGIRGKDQITAFVKIMNEVGVATNIAAAEAATGFATLAGILGESTDKIEGMSNVLVFLGNNSRATESRIMDFATRISGAAAVIGMTSTDVLGLSAGFASVGLHAELGGTAINRMLIEMHKAVTTNSDALEIFYRIAGNAGDQSIQTAEDFKLLFKTDPVEAFVKIIEGLMNSGDDAVLALNALRLDGIRVNQSMLAAAKGVGTLDQFMNIIRESVTKANKALGEGNARTNEFGIRMETTANQIGKFWNAVKKLEVVVGDAMLPVIKFAANTLQAFTEWAALHPILSQTIILTTALAGAMLALGGLTSLMVAFGVRAAGGLTLLLIPLRALVAGTLFAQLATGIFTLGTALSSVGFASVGAGLSNLGLAMTGVGLAFLAIPALAIAATVGLLYFLGETKTGQQVVKDLGGAIEGLGNDLINFMNRWVVSGETISSIEAWASYIITTMHNSLAKGATYLLSFLPKWLFNPDIGQEGAAAAGATGAKVANAYTQSFEDGMANAKRTAEVKVGGTKSLGLMGPDELRRRQSEITALGQSFQQQAQLTAATIRFMADTGRTTERQSVMAQLGDLNVQAAGAKKIYDMEMALAEGSGEKKREEIEKAKMAYQRADTQIKVSRLGLQAQLFAIDLEDKSSRIRNAHELGEFYNKSAAQRSGIELQLQERLNELDRSEVENEKIKIALKYDAMVSGIDEEVQRTEVGHQMITRIRAVQARDTEEIDKREKMALMVNHFELMKLYDSGADQRSNIEIQLQERLNELNFSEVENEKIKIQMKYDAMVNGIDEEIQRTTAGYELIKRIREVQARDMVEIDKREKLALVMNADELRKFYEKAADQLVAVELQLQERRNELQLPRHELEMLRIKQRYDAMVNSIDEEVQRTSLGYEKIKAIRKLQGIDETEANRIELENANAALADYTEKARRFYEDDRVNVQREYASIEAAAHVHFRILLATQELSAGERLAVEKKYAQALHEIELERQAASIKADHTQLQRRLDTLEMINRAEQNRLDLVLGIYMEERRDAFNHSKSLIDATGHFFGFWFASLIRAGNAIDDFWKGIDTLTKNTVGHITNTLEEGLFQLFKNGTVDMRSLWEKLMDDMLHEITRFLAQQAVKQLLMLIAGMFGFEGATVGSTGGGGVLGGGGAAATAGSLATQIGVSIGKQVGTRIVGDTFNKIFGGGSTAGIPGYQAPAWQFPETGGGRNDPGLGGEADFPYTPSSSGGGGLTGGFNYNPTDLSTPGYDSFFGSGGGIVPGFGTPFSGQESIWNMPDFGGFGSDLGSFNGGGAGMFALNTGGGISGGGGFVLNPEAGPIDIDLLRELNAGAFTQSASVGSYTGDYGNPDFFGFGGGSFGMSDMGSMGVYSAEGSIGDLGRTFASTQSTGSMTLALAEQTPGAWEAARDYITGLGTSAGLMGLSSAISLGTGIGVQAVFGVPTSRSEAAGQMLASRVLSSVAMEGAKTAASMGGVGAAPTSGFIAGARNLTSNFSSGGLSGVLFGTAGGATVAANAAQATALGAGANIATASEAAAAASSGGTGATGGFFGAGGGAIGAGVGVATVALSAGTAAWEFAKAFNTLAGGSEPGMISEAQMNAAYGALTGLAAGAIIGTIIQPGGGTAVGAALGAAVGGMIGGLFGDEVPPAIKNKIERAQTAMGAVKEVATHLSNVRSEQELFDAMHARMGGTSGSVGQLLYSMAYGNLVGEFIGDPWKWQPNAELGVLIPLLESMGITTGTDFNVGRVNSKNELIAASGRNPVEGAQTWDNLLGAFAGAVATQFPGTKDFAMPALDDYGLALRFAHFTGPNDPRMPTTIDGWNSWIQRADFGNTAGYSMFVGVDQLMGRQGLHFRDLPWIRENYPSDPAPFQQPQVFGAQGGLVTTDTVPAMLTPKEFISTVDSTSRNYHALAAGNQGAVLTTRSGGGMVVNININGDVKDPRELARVLTPILRDELRRIDDRRSVVGSKRRS